MINAVRRIIENNFIIFPSFIMTIIVYLIGLFGLFSENSIRLDYNLVFYFWIAQIFRMNLFKKIEDIQELIFFITLVFLFIIPSIAIFYFHKVDVTNTLFLAILFMDLLKKFSDKQSKNIYNKISYISIKPNFFIYSGLLLWSAIMPFFFRQANTLSGQFVLVIPFIASLVYLEEIFKQLKSIRLANFLLIFHFFFVVVYLSNHWSGHGRVVLAVWILAPIIIYMYVFKKFIKPIYIILLCFLPLYILQFSRYENKIELEDVFIGSAGYHLQLTNLTWINKYSFEGSGWQGFLDQYKLLFFAWIPRELWELKPIQINVYSVDVMFDRKLFSWEESYSHSIGFLGEQLFLLQNNYFLGLLLLLVTIIIIRKLVVKFSIGSVVPAIIFDLNLMSYFWGGMGIFGARIWFFLLPVLTLLILRFTIRRFSNIVDK